MSVGAGMQPAGLSRVRPKNPTYNGNFRALARPKRAWAGEEAGRVRESTAEGGVASM